jgi:hypothetical protein
MSPAEILAAIQAFQLLEPEVQIAVVALIHKLQGHKATAEDYINLAQAQINATPPAPVVTTTAQSL